MTNKEAIELLKKMPIVHAGYKEVIELACKSLEENDWTPIFDDDPENRIEFLGLSKNDKARVDEMDKCIAEVINAPIIEPERKKGAWINEGRKIRCSKCKIGYATVKGMKSALTYNFCPNCGADMRGERDGKV